MCSARLPLKRGNEVHKNSLASCQRYHSVEPREYRQVYYMWYSCYVRWRILFVINCFGIKLVLCDLYLNNFDLTKVFLFDTFFITVLNKLCRCNEWWISNHLHHQWIWSQKLAFSAAIVCRKVDYCLRMHRIEALFQIYVGPTYFVRVRYEKMRCRPYFSRQTMSRRQNLSNKMRRRQDSWLNDDQ